jgi:hypothetical protein
MQKSARYLPGRQLLVHTNVAASLPSDWTKFDASKSAHIGQYDPTGPFTVTHRATLVGEDPQNAKNFLVHVDGRDAPLSMSKESIYALNQPQMSQNSDVKSSTERDVAWGGPRWHIDYASPLAKAKLCEIALKMDLHVQQIDFTQTKPSGGMAHILRYGAMPQPTVALQKSCVEVVFRAIDMKYPRKEPFTDPGRVDDEERDVARQAIRGVGMCVQQSAVFGALLMPFLDILGIDAQYKSGRIFRAIDKPVNNVFSNNYATGHGWWQLTFRPSMEMTVADRTWNQVNQPLDRAYGFPFGDRHPSSNIAGYVNKPLSPTDVDVTGNARVDSVTRQVAQVGDGRENHISNNN